MHADSGRRGEEVGGNKGTIKLHTSRRGENEAMKTMEGLEIVDRDGEVSQKGERGERGRKLRL